MKISKINQINNANYYTEVSSTILPTNFLIIASDIRLKKKNSCSELIILRLFIIIIIFAACYSSLSLQEQDAGDFH